MIKLNVHIIDFRIVDYNIVKYIFSVSASLGNFLVAPDFIRRDRSLRFNPPTKGFLIMIKLNLLW